MKFNNPIPRTGLPNFHESSRLRSARDSDAVPRVWQKTSDVKKQLYRTTMALEELQRKVMRIRLRLAGEEESLKGWRWADPKKYDTTKGYSEGEVVVVLATMSCVADGLPSADDGGVTIKADPGIWVALQGVQRVNVGTTEAPSYRYHLPRLPMPSGDGDPDSTSNYWFNIKLECT